MKLSLLRSKDIFAKPIIQEKAALYCGRQSFVLSQRAKPCLLQTKPSLRRTKPRLSQTKPHLSQTKPRPSQTKLCASQTNLLLAQAKLCVLQTNLLLLQIKLCVSRTNLLLAQTKLCASQTNFLLFQIKVTKAQSKSAQPLCKPTKSLSKRAKCPISGLMPAIFLIFPEQLPRRRLRRGSLTWGGPMRTFAGARRTRAPSASRPVVRTEELPEPSVSRCQCGVL